VHGDVSSTYGFTQTDVIVELRAIMLGRIVKFRRGDQYEEMKGRDVAGGTAEADKTPASNVHSSDQTNQLPAGTGNSTVGHQDTTPDGSYTFLLYPINISY